MAVSKDSLLLDLCKAAPGFRDHLVASADVWLSSEGEILWVIILSELASLIKQDIESGSYRIVEPVFFQVERFLVDGDEEVKNLVATVFLESMLNDSGLEQELWRPLLGRLSELFCEKTDRFYGR